MAVETARASPNRRNVPKVFTEMTERHQMRTLTKNQRALFFGMEWYSSVVSQESVRIALTIAALNALHS